MGRIKEPTLFRVILLDEHCFGNSAGDRLNIKAVDKNGDMYYYDGFHRWTILEKAEEGISWKRIHGKNDIL